MVEHIFKARQLVGGPLTEVSAYRYEACYGDLRRGYGKGSNNAGKQVMDRALLGVAERLGA